MSAPCRRFPPAPTHSRALVLRAHPNAHSFNHALANAYAKGLSAAGLTLEFVDTDALAFDLRLRGPDLGSQALEPAIESLQAQLALAAHLVVASPVWWGSVPASLKGLIDRTFLPGWAYRNGDGALPERGLGGRSARVLLTMDAPGWWDRLKYGRSASRQLDDAWLQFVGIKALGAVRFADVARSDLASRKRMLERAERLGIADGVRVMTRKLARVPAQRLPEGVSN